MARLFTGGFESGDLLLDGWAFGETDLGAGSSPTSLPPTVSSSVNEHRTLDGTNGGAFGVKLFTSAGQKTMWIEQVIASNPTDCYIRLCIRKSTTGGSVCPMILFYDQAASFVGQIYISRDGADRLSVYGSTGTLAATSAPGHTIPESSTAFTRIEIHLTVTTGAFNIIEFRVDDIPWTEMATRFGPGGATGFGKFRLQGCWNNQAGGNTSTVIYDDIAVNDTTGSINNGFCGNGFIQALKPNAAGTFTQLFNSAGNQTNNYTYVNTLPVTSNGTNAVGTGTANTKDTYNMDDLPAPALGVNAVVLAAYVSKNGPAVSNMNLVGIFNSVEDDGGSIALPIGSPNWVKRTLDLNPTTGLPFTRSDINANTEVGVKFLA